MRDSISISVTDTMPNSKAYNFLADLDGGATKKDIYEYIRQAHIFIAKDTVQDAVRDGFDENYRTVVDKRFDVREEMLRPFGQIEYLASVNVYDGLVKIYDFILKKSKIVSGTYKNANFVFYKGRIVAKNMLEFKTFLDTFNNFKEGDVIRFANLTPYARRLEYLGVSKGKVSQRSGKASSRYSRQMKGRGVTINKGDRISKPNGAYHLAFIGIKRSFKALNPKEEFVLGSSLSGLPINSKFRTTFSPNGKYRRRQGPYLYPSIVVKLSSRGSK